MRAGSRILLSIGAVLATLASASAPARAQNAGDDAAGIALFNDAKSDAARGDWAAACPKFAEAERLHPAAAILLNLAECYEHVNRLASAWGAWKDAEIMARNAHDAKREQVAIERGQAIAPKLAKLAIVVPPATRVPGLEVRKDEVVVGEGQYGASLPADVGQHTVGARAPGHKPWSTVVRIETNGAAASVEIPALEDAPPEAPAGSGAAPALGPQRIAGISVVAAGVVALGVATGFGVEAIQKNDASKAQCLPNAPSMCFQAGADLRLSAGRAADASTALVVAGGLTVAAGLTVFFTAPSSRPATTGALQRLTVAPIAGPGVAGLSLRGEW
jgi:hypothetical protein